MSGDSESRTAAHARGHRSGSGRRTALTYSVEDGPFAGPSLVAPPTATTPISEAPSAECSASLLRRGPVGRLLLLRVVLTGRLSNHDLTTLFQSLVAREWKQVERRPPSGGGVSPDGRRKFGTVRDAIVEVLAQARSDLRVRDIQKGVEDVLGGPVSTSSVKDYLRKGCRRQMPLFEYRGRRGYRLAR